jgi:hypothetical protein
MQPNTEHAYLAGFIDGEGSFGVSNQSISLRVTNTHFPVLERLRELWGGAVILHGEGDGVRRTSWQWQLYGEKVTTAIRDMWDHLREKRPQAGLLLEWRDTRPGDPLRPWIRKALKTLKRLETPLVVRMGNE